MPLKDPIKKKAYDRLRHKKKIKERYALINQIKDIPCLDCEIKYPPHIMEFDHRDSREKSFSINEGIRGNWSIERIYEEIRKCDLVCANCHRERTYWRWQTLGRP